MKTMADLLASSPLVRRDDNGTLPDGTRQIYLHAGHLHVARDATRITTVLGSCVAIAMWDPRAGVGGMNHYMLPDDIGNLTANPRYANFAIRTLMEELIDIGAQLGRLEAKVFGGASVVSALNHTHHLGLKNIEIARIRLAEARIPIVGEDVGGYHGRKVVFSTASGETIVKRV